jgi:hypothetical protein
MSEKVKRKAAEFSPIRKWWATIFGITTIAVISVGYIGHFVGDKFVLMPLYLLRISDDGFSYLIIALIASIVMIISVFDFPVLTRNRSQVLIRLTCIMVLIAFIFVIVTPLLATDQPWIRYYQTINVNNRQWVIFSELYMNDRHTLFIFECDVLRIMCSRIIEYDDYYGQIFDLMFKEEGRYFVYDIEQTALVLNSSDRVLWTHPIELP